MSGFEHPSYEDLLLLESGELEEDRFAAVERHVVACQECQDRYGKVRSVRAVVAASEAMLGEKPGIRAPVRHYARPMIAAATAAALAVYLFTQGTPAARADALLGKAVLRQSGEPRIPHALRLQGEGTACYATVDGEITVPAGGEDPQFCASLASILAVSGWSSRELFSARKFQTWRESLNEKVDSIVESEESTQVTTTTEVGVLRLASLEVRASDYLPIAARYDFMSSSAARTSIRVTAVEDVPDRAGAKAPVVPPAPPPPATAPAPEFSAIDPLDEREAEIRLALHAARADGNLQLAIDRSANGIQVWGVVPHQAARDAIARSLAAIEGVTTSVMTEGELYESEGAVAVPWAAYQGDSPPLAHDRLDALFRNDPKGRQEFLNELDAVARSLLGATKSRDELKKLAMRLESLQMAADLSRAASDFDPVVESVIVRIAERLELLVGPLARCDGRDFSHSEAVELYELVHKTAFLKVSGEELTLAQALARISELLH